MKFKISPENLLPTVQPSIQPAKPVTGQPVRMSLPITNRPLDNAPYSEEAERWVIGCCLQDKVCVAKCIETLRAGPAEFYDLRWSAVYKATLEAVEDGKEADIRVIGQYLKDKGLLESVGDWSGLSELANDVIPSAVDSYLSTVHEKYLAREMWKVCKEASGRLALSNGDAVKVMDEVERSVLGVRSRSDGHRDRNIKELVISAITTVERAFETKGKPDGVPTGLIDLDRLTMGFHAGELVVLSGFPGSGKTSLALNFIEHAALDHGLPVAVFSLEMTAEQVVTRILCSRSRVNMRSVSKGVMNHEAIERMMVQSKKLSESLIQVDDRGDASVYQIRAKGRRLLQQYGIKMAVIDYAQIIGVDGFGRRIDNDQMVVKEVSKQCKAMAKELGIPVVLLSQQNEKGQLKDSRSLWQDCDVWIRIEQEGEDESEQDDAGSDAIPVLLKVKKQRSGPPGSVPATFMRCYTRFENAAKENS